MSKTFLVYFEDNQIDGSKVMNALKKIKSYHHAQDVTTIEPMQELAKLGADYTRAIKANVEVASLNADLQERIEKQKFSGELMSKVLFNFSQQDRFTADERKMMKAL